MKYWVTGDFHGDVFEFINRIIHLPKEDAIIVLGDAGINYSGDHNDEYAKNVLNSLDRPLYLLRGNHEMRPQDVPGMECIFDYKIQGPVYQEREYLNIKYLSDHYIYDFDDGHSVGVIGGAYSVDKYYRLANKYKWFENEQLNDKEKGYCMGKFAGRNIDIILSHTCPMEWRPTDLFLPMLDQESVDTSMEEFLSDIRKYTDYGSWAFGHYHDDRNVRPGVYLLHKAVISLDDLIECKEIKDLKYDTKYDKED